MNPSPETAPVKYGVGDRVPAKLVCMVNDTYMGKPQIPVPIDGKTYYGCCQMCVKRLNENTSDRMGNDPYSGQAVDKTIAYIVLVNNKGKVRYFESKANFDAYANK